MRRKALILVSLVALAITGFSFLTIKTSQKPGGYIDHYSIDPLPESWKTNKSLVKAIDFIVTNSVKELGERLPCSDCQNAPYSVALLIDSPEVVKQAYEDIGNRKHNGGFNYECVTDYYFKSSLAIYDANQRGVAKVLITNPETDKYSVTRKFNVYHKAGGNKPTAEEYISSNSSEMQPTMEELMKVAEKKIYLLRDEIHKLYYRH